ncbi:MAG: hypothetical protein GXP41_07435 [Chloroflexi bacterium]|nr:hypothetical protein [Chloroflexota bacterium]
MSTMTPLNGNGNNRNMPFIIGAIGLAALLVVGVIALLGYMFFFQGGKTAKNQVAQLSPTVLPTSTAHPVATATAKVVKTATAPASNSAGAAAVAPTQPPTDTPAVLPATDTPAVLPATATSAPPPVSASGGTAASPTATAPPPQPTATTAVAQGQATEIPPTGLGGMEAIALGLGLGLILIVTRRLRTA